MDRSLRRRQLDRQVKPLDGAIRSRPTRGWATAVRQALGMSTRQLGERLGISQQSAAGLEKAEQNRSITLKNLERMATALDADLVYAFVPKTSFEQALRDQAEKVASSVIARVETSMSLEDQSTASEEQLQRKVDLVEGYVRSTPRDLWDQQ